MAASKGAEPRRLFKSKEDWAKWLDREHATCPGLWLRIAKKNSRLRSVTYSEALEVALCYGWIDGQKQSESEDCFLQRFLPRAPRSLWSKVNREKALALISSGDMKPAGLAAIENAKRTGRWDRAYDSPSKASVPEDLQAALEQNPEAKEFFEGLNGVNRYAIIWRIQTAIKEETRARKIEQFIQMLQRKERIHE